MKDKVPRSYKAVARSTQTLGARMNYQQALEQQAALWIAKGMALEPIRELLILSAHSCASAKAFLDGRLDSPALAQLLLEVVRDPDDSGSGDARIEAAHYLGLLTGELLKAHDTELLALFDAENGDAPGGNIRPLLSLALARPTRKGEAPLLTAQPER